MRKLISIFICLFVATVCQGRIITVGHYSPPGGIHYDFETIQAAIDDSNDGDEIIVAKGRYYENINFKGKNVILRSTDPNDPDKVAEVIIDGWRKGHVVTLASGEDANCVLDGFTIVRGEADSGGGIFCSGTKPTIRNCIIYDNIAQRYGGGVFFEGLGMDQPGDGPTITKCTIHNNTVRSLGSGGGGIWSDTSLTITECAIMKNSAPYSSGIQLSGKQTKIYKCIIKDNVSKYPQGPFGGGIVQYGGGCLTELSNCLIVGNKGAGFSCVSGNLHVIITNCTISGNTNVGIWNREGSDVCVFNSIVWGNSGGQINSNYPWSRTDVKYGDVQGGWSGEGNIDADPCFVRPGYWNPNRLPDDTSDDLWVDGDYHLKSQAGRWDPNGESWVLDDVTSPCIDAGDPSGPIDYEPPPNGGIINMGAYGGTAEASKTYFNKPLCKAFVPGDINGDCKVDFKDFAFMAFHWLEEH